MVLQNLVDSFESDVPVKHSAESLVPVQEMNHTPTNPLKTKPNQTKPNQNNNKNPNKNKNKGNQKMVLWNLVDNFESDVPVEHSAEGLVPVLEEVLVERPVLHVAIQHITQAA